MKRIRRGVELFNRAAERRADSEKLCEALTNDLADARAEIVRLNAENADLRAASEQSGEAMLAFAVVAQAAEATIRSLKAKLAQSNGHNYGPRRPEWERNVAVNLRMQAIADSAEPEFTARELSNAMAVVEGDLELQRAARGEPDPTRWDGGHTCSEPAPVTEKCPDCDGEGEYTLGEHVGKTCLRCHGTGVVLVKGDAGV
jgi:hypothetical protein